MTIPASTTYLDCPVDLTQEQIATYWEQGYIVFENALSPDEVGAARRGFTEIVERYAFNDELCDYKPGSDQQTNYSGGIFKAKGKSVSFQLEPGYTPSSEDPREIVDHIRKYISYQDETPLFKEIYTSHPRIQGVLKSLLGNDLELHQCMGLVKAALGGVEKPWHQDNAYFSIENLDQVIGTWIALDDTTVDNGCMHLIPGGHKAGPRRHYHTFDCEIVPDRIKTSEAIPIELKAGGMLIFHSNLPHQTPTNHSDQRRRALQYHFRATANKVISKEEYGEVFTEQDGTPASCVAARPENF